MVCERHNYQNNPGDYDRIKDAFSNITDEELKAAGGNMPQLAGGTGGRYVDWGRSTTVQLHGREKVVPEGSEATGPDALAARLDRIAEAMERRDRDLPFVLSAAIKGDQERDRARLTRQPYVIRPLP